METLDRSQETQEIFALLDERFSELADYLFPGAVRHKGSVFPAAKGKDLGSFEICIAGPKRGRWFRNSVGVGGHPIQLIAFVLNGDMNSLDKAVFDEARRFLGIADRPVSQSEKAARDARIEEARRNGEERRRIAEAKAQEDLLRRQDTAAEIWDRTVPIYGSPGELYLINRGLMLSPWPDALRYHRSLRHPSGEYSGAIVARVSDASDRFMGIWRIYVTEHGSKAFGGSSKLGLGEAAGGSVRLFEPVNGEIGTCEGIEDAIAIRILTKGLAAPWPALSTSGVQNFEVPFEIRRVRIFPDFNVHKRCKTTGKWLQPPGQMAARKLAERLSEEGIPWTMEAEPKGGGDYNAMLNILQDRGLF